MYKQAMTRLSFSVLVISAVFFTSSCEIKQTENNRSVSERTSIVKNRKAVPDFELPQTLPDKHHVSFIAIGDQGKGGRSQRHVARLMNEKAAEDPVKFVMTLGDNFYKRGVTSVSDKQWSEKFEDMYNLPYLAVPFYATLGNHDHKDGNARHQVEYSKKNARWVMPDNYYTFSKSIDAHSSVQFFALDTTVINQQSENYLEQIRWLDQALMASTATWKIVLGHHPVFSYGKHGDQEQMIDQVRPLLEKHEVDVYISGHDHDRQLLKPSGGVYYIISGTGSRSRDTQYGEHTVFAETNLGFVWCLVSASQFHVQFIDLRGDVEFAHTWSKGTASWREIKTQNSSQRMNKSILHSVNNQVLAAGPVTG